MIDQSHLHPMIVHFPIALIIIGFLSDLVGAFTRRQFFITAGLYLIALGSVGTIAAYLSGNLAGDGVTEAGALGTALETHEGAATLALWTMIVLAAVRVTLGLSKTMTGWRQWAMVALLALGVGTIARTGYYGGELVYKHAAGVQLTFGIVDPAGTGQSNEKTKSAQPQDND
ncbi:MAG: DUF2231 domain-containing protein [Candidatus Zixiibacteriota bacterium]